MTPNGPKYGTALTGSNWIGLPLRIGEVPERGVIEDLHTDTDAILTWIGGPSEVRIAFSHPSVGKRREHHFERTSGMLDLLPRGTRLHQVIWSGRPSICTSVNLPRASLVALRADPEPALDDSDGPRFGLIDAHVVDLVQRLRAQAEGQEDYGAVYVQSLSLTLVSYVTARYGRGTRLLKESRRSQLSSAQRTEIERFIDHQLARDFGLLDLASLVGYCPDHFSRLFKETFRQSPHQYVLSRRIEKAKAMLRDEGVSIAEIAEACGFASQGHLSTVFKQRTGMPPGAYRRS